MSRPGSGAAAEQGCFGEHLDVEGLTGRRGRAEQVQTFPGTPARPLSLPGRVRPSSPRRRRPGSLRPAVAPQPRPRSQPLKASEDLPVPGIKFLGRTLLPWNSGPVTREGNQPKFLLSRIVKLENTARSTRRCLLPSSWRRLPLQDVRPRLPLTS